MINTKIVEAQRKANISAAEIELYKQSFVIIPYQVSGFIDYTNRGVSVNQINPEDFETFKRVWTGNDACVISWKNSVHLKQNLETKEMEVHYQLGEFFLGAMESCLSENRIQADESFSNYKSQDIKSSMTLFVDKKWEITDHYLFMFYKIPEVSGSTLYRISNIEKNYIGRNLQGYLITFETINQDLANTGRARQQNIMPNAPGQGYLEAKVEELKDFETEGLIEGIDYIRVPDNERVIIADYQKTLNRPVKKVVVKLLGNGILNSFVMSGRPVIKGDKMESYKPARLLFPYEIEPPTTPTLFNNQSNSNNYYFGNFNPTLEYFKDLMNSIKDSLTPVNKFNYQGWLTYSYSDLISTNPKEDGKNGSKYKYELYGGLEKLNDQYVYTSWTFSSPKKAINTLGVAGCSNTYNIGGLKKLHDHLWDNWWTQKQYKSLPLNTQNTLTFGNTVMSGLGSALWGAISGNWKKVFFGLGLFAVGISGTLLSKLKTRKLETYRGIVNAAFIDYVNPLYKQTDNLGNKIPFNFLDSNNKETPNTIFFDGSSLMTGFQSMITDRFTTERIPNKVLTTINIGQTKYESGDKIFENGSILRAQGDEQLVGNSNLTRGYIIDGFKIQACFNGEISVEFLDFNNEVVWTGIYQSEGKWTNSMREIWTEKNCSVFGRENVFFSEPIPYPEPIPEEQGDIIVSQAPAEPVNGDNLILGEQTHIEFEKIFKGLHTVGNYNFYANCHINDWGSGNTSYYPIAYCFPAYNGQVVEKEYKIFDYNVNIDSFDTFRVYYDNFLINIKQNFQFTGDNWIINTDGNYTGDIPQNNNLKVQFDRITSQCPLRQEEIFNKFIDFGQCSKLNVDYDITNQFVPFEEKEIIDISSGSWKFRGKKKLPFNNIKLRFYEKGSSLFCKFIITTLNTQVKQQGVNWIIDQWIMVEQCSRLIRDPSVHKVYYPNGARINADVDYRTFMEVSVIPSEGD